MIGDKELVWYRMRSPDSERTMHTYLGITAELTAEQIDFEPFAKMAHKGLSTSDTARIAGQTGP